MEKRPSWIYVVAAIILAFGLYLIVPDRNICHPTDVTEKVVANCHVSYSGVEGQNALEILKSNHQVETQKFSFGELVNSINGVKAPSTHFWAFYINDQQAEVGAGDYITKDTDTITWKLEAISLTQ